MIFQKGNEQIGVCLLVRWPFLVQSFTSYCVYNKADKGWNTWVGYGDLEYSTEMLKQKNKAEI